MNKNENPDNPALRSFLSGHWQQLLLIIAVYFSSWLFLLLNTGSIYWDDWVLYKHNPDTLIHLFSMTGYTFVGYMHNFLGSFDNSIGIYRLATFSGHLITALAIYRLLLISNIFTNQQCLLITLLFAVYPSNHARVALINTPSALFLALYFMAFVAMAQHQLQGGLHNRIIAVLCFCASATFVPSLMMFYAVPMAYMLFIKRRAWIAANGKVFSTHNVMALALFLARRLDYLLFPVACFLIRGIFYPSTELYANYNNITIHTLSKAAPETIRFILNLGWLPLSRLASGLPLYLSVLFLVFSLLVALGGFSRKSYTRIAFGKAMIQLALGCLLLFIAVYPYYVVGKAPSFSNWGSRHQLLMPLGVAIIITTLCLALFNKRYVKVIFGLLLTGCILINNQDMIAYHIDGIKQDAVIHQLQRNNILKNAHNQVLVFDNQSQSLDAFNRNHSFYELSGYLRQAFGNSSNLGISSDDCETTLIINPTHPVNFSDYYLAVSDNTNDNNTEQWIDANKIDRTIVQRQPYAHYNFSDFDRTQGRIAGKILIREGNIASSSITERLSLIKTRMLDHDMYQTVLDNIIKIEMVPVRQVKANLP